MKEESKLYKNLKEKHANHAVHLALRRAVEKGKLVVRIDDGIPTTSADIVGFWAPSKDLSGLVLWVEAIVEWVKSCGNYIKDDTSVTSPRSWWSFFRYAFAIHPFRNPWSGWLWVVDSLENEVEIYLEDRSWKIIERKHNVKNLPRRRPDVISKYGNLKDREKVELRKNFNADKDPAFQLWLLEERKLERQGNVYFSQNDPTVFTVDHRICPYDDGRGWKERGIQSAMELWLREVGVIVPAEIQTNHDN